MEIISSLKCFGIRVSSFAFRREKIAQRRCLQSVICCELRNEGGFLASRVSTSRQPSYYTNQLKFLLALFRVAGQLHGIIFQFPTPFP